MQTLVRFHRQFHFAVFSSVSYEFNFLTFNIKVKNDHRSKFSNLSNWREEA